MELRCTTGRWQTASATTQSADRSQQHRMFITANTMITINEHVYSSMNDREVKNEYGITFFLLLLPTGVLLVFICELNAVES